MVACIISFYYLKKEVKLKFNIYKIILKPLLASIIMGFLSFLIFYYLKGIINAKMATIIILIFSIIVYFILILCLKIISREEIFGLKYLKK